MSLPDSFSFSLYHGEKIIMLTKLIIIILDGCRPDGLAAARTPHIDALWGSGAYSWHGQTVMPSVTLPAHMSMFRSVSPERHGVGADNVFNPAASAFPSLFDIAQADGLHTAFFYSWEQLRDLAAPGSLTTSAMWKGIKGRDNDTRIAAAAADFLEQEQPDLLVLYLGDVDFAGHLHGWMSPGYIATIEQNDAAVGIVITALESNRLREDYTILLLSDHGGHDFGHGTDAPEDMTIIWMANGASIRSNYMLEFPPNIMDTAPTAAMLLGIEPSPLWEGRALTEILA